MLDFTGERIYSVLTRLLSNVGYAECVQDFAAAWFNNQLRIVALFIPPTFHIVGCLNFGTIEGDLNYFFQAHHARCINVEIRTKRPATSIIISFLKVNKTL